MQEEPLTPHAGGSQHDEEEIAALLRSAGSADRVPDSELPAIKAVAREAWQRQVRRTAAVRRAVYASLALAATLIVAFGVAVLLRPDRSGLPAEPQMAATLETVIGEATLGDRPASEAAGGAVASGTRIETSGDGRAALRLADGHTVRVDVESSLRLDSGRSLRLERGAIYVESSASTAGSGSIEIDTPLGRVTDLGTRFEVRLDRAPDGAAGSPVGLRVLVREGAVLLSTGAATHEAAAGSELYLHAGGDLDRAAAAPYGDRWQWIEGVHPPLEIQGATLEVFLDWAARESGRSWRFAAPERDGDRGTILHGSIEGLTVEEALSTVLPSCGFRHRIAGDELLIEN